MLRKVLDYEVQGHSVQKLSLYGVGAFVSLKTVSYGYWVYRNSQVKAKARALRKSKLDKTY